MRTYNYTYYRREYPEQRGYRMHRKELPDWICIKIENKDSDTKQVFVESRLHMDKRVKVGPDYASNYTNREILIELSAEISRRWLK